ncbi:hypothetical protein [Providencia burhodogranariea]|uniref:Uncharacterized protein n=1 Tax=Providencia burhodogranariea DSM 19968 TaxID=1141662 RepID=K8W8F2_9GAMM|nr:hypothetical protein [Providencia burhodogranariea]EKT56151.1 hypothetical protein OOA_16102 [Providencia burhodogranariea DSM 19968]
MKNKKMINSQVFSKIISVNGQKEDEFNNGQDGAIILSLLVMFFVPFLFLNSVRQWLHIDYNLASVIGMLVISIVLAFTLYKKLNLNERFANKTTSLNELLSSYVPNNKAEFDNLKAESKNNPVKFLDLVDEWVKAEKVTYAK